MDRTYTYSVILEPMEEGGLLVRVPALPEVVTYGDDEEHALAMAKEAIELVIGSRLERGESVPPEVAETRVRQMTVSVAA